MGLEGNTLQLSELDNASMPLPMDISEEKSGASIRELLWEGKRVGTSFALYTTTFLKANKQTVVRVKSFLEIRRIVKYNHVPERPDWV